MSLDTKDTSISINKEEPSLPAVSLLQLLRYASFSDKVNIGIGTLASIAAGFSWPLMTILFGDIVDVFVEYENGIKFNNTNAITLDEFLNKTYFLSGSLFGLTGLLIICNYLVMACFPFAAINQIHTIRMKYFQSVLKQEIAWFDSRPSGDFASKISADLKRVEDGINEKLGLAIHYLSATVIDLVTAFIYGWKLTLVVLALTPVLAASTAVMTKVQATFARKEMESYSAAGTVAEEVISAIRTVFAFGGEAKEVERYEKNLFPAMKSGIRRNFVTGLGNGITWACLYGGLALGIWFGVKLIIDSEVDETNPYTIGTIVIVFWCVSSCGWNIGNAAPHFEAIQMARGTAAIVFDTIERKPTIDSSSLSGDQLKNLEANIEFRDVHFSYPMRSEVKVLNGFNLKIKSGETVALVGPSGCGKSTIIQLIQRFYDPTSGHVLIDGKDIKELNLGWIREQIGVVGQEPVLFDTSIIENIILGSCQKSINRKDIEFAAIEANAHEFIMKLPEKYETYVGDRGAQLSGGQKQRIAIARALISKPKLLLLDEATSALDLQSEALVQTALDRASKGRTTIIVAHRLSTIINSDRIFFIDNGEVKETGSHTELMAKKGLYYNLVVAQQTQSKNAEDIEDYNENDLNIRRTTSIESDPMFAKDSNENNEPKEVLKRFSQMRLLRMLAMDKFYIIIGLLCSILYSLVIPIYALIFGALIEVFAENTDNEIIWKQSVKYALYYIALAVGVCLTSVTQITMFGIAGERLTMRLRKMAFAAILRQEIAWFDKSENSTGSLCARLSSDAANIQGASGSRMSVICQATTTFVSSAIFGFVINWKLSLLTMASMPLIVIGSVISINIVSSQLTSDKEATEKSSKIAIEAIGGIRTVASLHKEEYFLSKYIQILESKLKVSKRRCHLKGITLGFAQSVVFLSYAASFLYGGILISKSQLKSGDFFKIIETMIYGAMIVGQSAVFTSDYQKAKIAAANIFRLIDRQPLKNINNNFSAEKQIKCNGNLDFRGVHFNYPNRPEAKVLNGLSFKVAKGETVALVGSSGCGKSTSIQLIERFYDCTEGKIMLDGKNINSLSIQWLRSQMALVSQEPILFSYSIRDNIAYGDNSRFVDMDEIVNAAYKANIHHFITDLPNGYDTNVGNKGTQLSGGQKQRIAIARALIRNPQILLLDEATSALDTASEKSVQSALDEASKGRTCIVIAHRLTTIQNADRIVVMQKGVSVEEGVHQQLLQRKGVYYKLYNFQIK